MKIIKQEVNYRTRTNQIKCEFVEHDVLLENANEYVISEIFCGEDRFKIVRKPHAKNGSHTIDDVWTHGYELSDDDYSVTVVRYKLEDDEHDFDFYEIASHEFANFECTKDLWINRNGEIEPRRSEVA